MKITPKINQIKNTIREIKATKLENRIQKFVNIEDVTNVGAYNALYPARKGIADYAKANNVKVFMYNTANKSKNAEDTLHIAVTNKKGGIAAFVMDRYEGMQYIKSKDINGNTKAIETVERTKKRILEDKDGLNYMVTAKEQQDETFLRRVYRAVSELTNKVNKANK